MKILSLFEVRRRWEPDDTATSYNLIGFRGDYWILPDDFNKVPDEVLDDIMNKTGIDELTSDMNWYEIASDLTDTRPDIIAGTFDLDNDTLSLGYGHTNEFGINPATSSFLKKIMLDLGLTTISTIDYDQFSDFEQSDTRYNVSPDMKGKIPKVLFHGTSAQHIRGILRTGIRSGLNHNYKNVGIAHQDIIFGAVHLDMVIGHAYNATRGLYELLGSSSSQPDEFTMHEFGNFPVVLEFRIPDPARLVPDYDVAANLIGQNQLTDHHGYTGMSDFHTARKGDAIQMNPEGRIWKNTGKFGYAGRIPPSHIIRIHTNFYDGVISPGRPHWIGLPGEFKSAWKEAEEAVLGDSFGYEDEENEDY